MLLLMALILGWIVLSLMAVVLCAAARRGDDELAAAPARRAPVAQARRHSRAI